MDRAERIVRGLCQALMTMQAKAGPERWILADNLRERLRQLTDEQFDLAVASRRSTWSPLLFPDPVPTF